MPLTPEEELELRMLEDSEPRIAPDINTDAGLSPEEQLELAALEQAEKQDISTGESFVRGAVQGVTFGFADEATGIVEAGIRKIRGDQGDFNEIYEQERNIVREKNRLASEANPKTSFAGSLIGGAGPLVASGGTLAGFRAAAVLGGLSGVGFSNAKGTELAKDAAIGTALGLGGEAVFKGIGKAIGKMVGKTSVPTNQVLEAVGETAHPQNVSFETSIYKQALKGGFPDMDSFFSSKEAKQAATTWGMEAHKIPKDIIRNRIKDASAKLKAIITSPENQNKKVNIGQIVDDFLDGDAGLKQFRSQGAQAKAVKAIKDQIIEPLQTGKLRLNGKIADANALDFDQSIEFKRLVGELTFQNSDIALDTAEQFAFRKAPAVSNRLQQFAGDIIESTNAADGTGLLKGVNGELSQLIDAESLIPRSLKELRSLTGDFGDTKMFMRGQQFLLKLDQIDPALKKQVANEIVPTLTLVDAVDTARQWNLGVSTLFQAKAGVAAVGPLGALVAAGQGGTLLAAQGVGKAAKAAFKIPRTIAGIMGNANIVVQKISDLSPAMAVTINDLIHTRDVEGLRGAMEAALADPNLRQHFEQGLGFEGKITSPEEASQVRNQIMGSRIPLSQKIEAVNVLDQTQQIPQIPEPQPEQPRPMVLQRKVSRQSMNLVRKTEKELGE